MTLHNLGCLFNSLFLSQNGQPISGQVRLLVIGYWLLVIGYWLLGNGYWLLGNGYWLLGNGYWLLGNEINN